MSSLAGFEPATGVEQELMPLRRDPAPIPTNETKLVEVKEKETKGDAKKELDIDADDDDEPKHSREVFNRPLVYYKRNTPFLRTRRRSRGPTQIMWPDKSISLGFPPEKAGRERDDRKLDDNLVVFTSPGEEQIFRRKRLMVIIIGLLALQFIIITSAFGLGDDKGAVDVLAYISSLLSIALAIVGMTWRNTRLITLYIVVLYADSLVGLLRMSVFWDWLRFFLQLIICQWMLNFKQTLVPTWFVPTP